MNTQLAHSMNRPPRPKLPGPLSTGPRRGSARGVMIALTACMALQATSFVMILPLFARRFEEFGAGVSDLGASSMAYAVAAMLTAPIMGALSDRFGRRPLVLGSLAAYALAFTGYMLVRSALGIILLRCLAGALTAGLIPAAVATVADLAPADRRGQWVAILGGGSSIGWIAGPIIGGMVYDNFGFASALLAAIGTATLTFIVALVSVPETRPHTSHPATIRAQASTRAPSLVTRWQLFRLGLPPASAALVLALLIYFAITFAWAFIEPRFMFYAYDDLGWSSSMLGLMMSTFGVSCMLGEFGLGRLSDRFGRKPVIMLGLLLFSAQFLGLGLARDDVIIAASFVVAGLGSALLDPALSASILDVAPRGAQGQLLGLKSTSGQLGSIAGPLLIVLFSSSLSARGVFLGAAGIVLVSFMITVCIKTVTGSGAAGRPGAMRRGVVAASARIPDQRGTFS